MFYGTSRNDILYGGKGEADPFDDDDTILGGDGHDIIYGNGGKDSLEGGDGADTLYGGLGNDIIYGGLPSLSLQDGADFIIGGPDSDVVYGGEGNDTLIGGGLITDPSDAADTLRGGWGDDVIYGNGGADSLEGEEGADTLHGGIGADTLMGGKGSDVLYGLLDGDILRGGEGIDRFIVLTRNSQAKPVHIQDMERNETLRIQTPSTDNVLVSTTAGKTTIAQDGKALVVLSGLQSGALEQVHDAPGDPLDIVFRFSKSSDGPGAPPPNSAPINSVAAAQSVAEDASLTFHTGGGNLISVSDSDNASLTAYTLTVTHGTLTLAGIAGLTFAAGDGTGDATMIFSGAITDINTALDGLVYAPTANYNGADTLTLTANDGTATDTDTIGITVTAVNDAPVNSVPAAQTTAEDTNKTFSSGGGNLISVSDIDNTSLTAYTLTVTQGTLTLAGTAGLVFAVGDGTSDATMTFSGTVAAINAALNGLIYAPTANYNGADTLTLTANDGATTDTDTVGITVTAVNDAPTLSGLDAVTFLENTANASAQIIDGTVAFSDDNANLSGGSVTVTYSAGGGAQDYLSIENQGTGAGQIGYDGTTVTYAGVSIGTIRGSNNGWAGGSLIVDLDSDATPAAVDALIEHLTYRNDSNAPTANRTLSITVSDGALAGAAATAVITVTAESDDMALSALDGTTGFRLDGIDAGDEAGASIASAGDVNGDGYDDIIIGAPHSDAAAGESYVVFGASSGWAASLDLSTLNGTTGFRLDGIDAGDLAGASVASAGDINADGYDDLFIGAYQSDAAAGEGYVVFGKAAGWAAAIDLATLDGTTGFRLDGIDAGDEAGFSVASAGDVNGDGYDDMLIGAPAADPGADASAGESYLVFGASAGWAAALDLNTLNGTTGVRFDGIDAGDVAGYSLASAGDLNGDGLADFILGAKDADGSAGESYVIFGKVSGWAANLDLSTLNGTTGFRLDGIDANDFSGFSVASAGDVNGDGLDDLAVGAYGGDPGGDNNAGESYIVFGAASGWAASLDLNTLNGTTGFRLDGIDANDLSGFSIASAGDFNGDGFGDILVGAKGAGGSAGESYVIFGKASGWAANLDLSTLSGTTGIRLDGIDANDASGISVASAGDVNGDGFDDLVVGASGGDPGGDAAAGEGYVIFGNNRSAPVDQIGGSGADSLTGTTHDDILIGSLGNDTLTTGDGDDVLKGGNGNDRLVGNDNDDRLFGGKGNDTLLSGFGDDLLYGGDGNDSMTGSNGHDKFWGGNGNDTLTGSSGADTMIGGLGNDVFSFVTTDSYSLHYDVITLDFDHDRLDIVGAAANTINTVAGVTANTVADVIAAYDNTNIDRVGDANYLHVTAGALAGTDYVILSTDGNASYDDNVDLFFQVIGGGTFTVADII